MDKGGYAGFENYEIEGITYCGYCQKSDPEKNNKEDNTLILDF